jgi:hypothetical protein
MGYSVCNSALTALIKPCAHDSTFYDPDRRAGVCLKEMLNMAAAPRPYEGGF